jgi:putative flippase GtrA
VPQIEDGEMNSVRALDQVAHRFAMILTDRALLVQATKFALIGVVNTCVDFGVFLLAFAFLAPRLVAANVLSWTVAVTGSYILNCSITFADRSGGRLRFRDFVSFVASGLAGLLANTTALVVGVQLLLLPVVVAKLFAIGVCFVVNFSLARFVVFRRRQP